MKNDTSILYFSPLGSPSSTSYFHFFYAVFIIPKSKLGLRWIGWFQNFGIYWIKRTIYRSFDKIQWNYMRLSHCKKATAQFHRKGLISCWKSYHTFRLSSSDMLRVESELNIMKQFLCNELCVINSSISLLYHMQFIEKRHYDLDSWKVKTTMFWREDKPGE